MGYELIGPAVASDVVRRAWSFRNELIAGHPGSALARVCHGALRLGEQTARLVIDDVCDPHLFVWPPPVLAATPDQRALTTDDAEKLTGALSVFWRVRCGQWAEAVHHLPMLDPVASRCALGEALLRARRCVCRVHRSCSDAGPFERSTSFPEYPQAAWRVADMDQTTRYAYDLQQEIELALRPASRSRFVVTPELEQVAVVSTDPQ